MIERLCFLFVSKSSKEGGRGFGEHHAKLFFGYTATGMDLRKGGCIAHISGLSHACPYRVQIKISSFDLKGGI